MLVYKIVLDEFGTAGHGDRVYLSGVRRAAAGAVQLHRRRRRVDNPAGNTSEKGKPFKGFPIPAAAGVIASLTELMLWLDAGKVQIGAWKFLLPPLMLFLSFMMFSQFRYPSFKAVNWRTQRTLPTFVCIIVVIVVTLLNYQWMPAVIFLSYLMYGFLRPWLSRGWRRDIDREIGERSSEAGAPEDEDDDEEEKEHAAEAAR